MWYEHLPSAESTVAVILGAGFLLCIATGADKEVTMSLGSGLLGFISHAAVAKGGPAH